MMEKESRRQRMGANPPSRSQQPWKMLGVALLVGLLLVYVDATEQVVLAGGATLPRSEDDFFTEFQQKEADVPRRVPPKAYQVVDDEDFDDEEFFSTFQREEMDSSDDMKEDEFFSGTFMEQPKATPRRMPPKISPKSHDDGETCSDPDIYVREQVYDEDCTEDDDECEDWEKHGECESETSGPYMIDHCRKHCKMCFKLDPALGMEQVVEDTETKQILELIASTNEYYYNEVMRDPEYSDLHREACQLKDELCAFWAVYGACFTNEKFMMINCAPVCKTCHEIRGEDCGDVNILRINTD